LHFKELDLNPSILSALESQGYATPTPVQAKAIPPVLQGRDVLGCAQTGTGKTAAFALPLLHLLSARPAAGGRPIRALVLTPTRELALQIQESFEAYGANLRLRTAVIFGGVGEGPQKAQLRQGVDILVATPGRLIDLMGQGALSLSGLEAFVLDEADRMLDMGFIHDVRRICQKVPARRQTLLFSATMPPEIRKLADTLLSNPVTVEVARVASTAEKIDQGVYFVPKEGKASLLRRILTDESMSRVIVFTRTKHGADRVRRGLEAYRIPAEAIHGNKSQGARQRSLSGFKDGSVRVLVATDIAARGIDVDGVSHVINYDLPQEPETYVHRIGRTARAGASGVAVSLCAPEDRPGLKDIERLIRKEIRVLEAPEGLDLAAMPAGEQVRRADEGRRDHGRRHEAAPDRQGRERRQGGVQQAAGKSRPHHEGNSRDGQGQRQAAHGRNGQGQPGQQGQQGGRHGGRGKRSRSGRTVVREYYSNRD
jgi:ATP-dependent RNA helicase RhlE